MNLDKTIQELTNRLDEVHPYSSHLYDHQNRNDGINYWKGKKIISAKKWNELYEKNSTYTDNYRITLISREPLQYFPDDYNSLISGIEIKDEKLREEIQKWNTDYYKLLEYRKNPTLGRMKCSKCLLSGSNDDPIFIGIEKVFARIVMKDCNNNDTVNDNSSLNITYHCNVMNIFSCPFQSKEESCNNNRDEKEQSEYPYKREVLFALHQVSFAIEQAITTFFEITKNNEIIYEVDFLNDRVQEVHTKYNGEPERWGWNDDVNGQLYKVKPISNIVIRDEQDVYDILTNREKFELLLQEYKKKINSKLAEQLQVCCDENTPCVPTNADKDNSNNKKIVSSTSNTIEQLDSANKKPQQLQIPIQELKKDDYLLKGENGHSKSIGDELDIEYLKPELKLKIKELEKSDREQLILLKQNKQRMIDFLLYNIDSIRLEDLKIYEPIYKYYRKKGNCYICNNLANIICKNCYNNYNNNKEIWLCTNHWKQHAIENHIRQLIR